ncbi:hypothetical protein MASR2M78_26310 [Treponema sp.]
MVSLEQVKLLETKVVKAIDIVKRVSEENAALRGKLDGYRSRIDELEVLVKEFKEDQGRIEAGILSALERLNQFEDAVEQGIKDLPQITSENDEPIKAVDPDSEEAILASLEAEQSAAAAANMAKAAVIETPSQQETEEEPPADAGGELDIF